MRETMTTRCGEYRVQDCVCGDCEALDVPESAHGAPVTAELCHGCAGWYVQWVQEDASAPMGFRAAHWYGTREACVARMAEPAPKLYPAHEGCPTDAATQTGMYD